MTELSEIFASQPEAVRIAGLIIDVLFTGTIFWLIAAWLYAVELIWQGEGTTTIASIASQFSFLMESGKYVWIYQLVIERDITFGTLYADFYRIAFLTTYFTSIWIWLFIIAAPLGRAVFALRGVLTRWGRIFNVEDHPIATLGYTLALITFVLHCLLYAGFSLAGTWLPSESIVKISAIQL